MAPPAASSSTRSPELTRLIAALAASAALLATPLRAQDTETLPTLEELIPDEAVANPEAWAEQGNAADAAAEAALDELDPASPLAELPGVDVPWPEDEELPQLAPLEPEDEIQFGDLDTGVPRVEMGAEEHISDELVLVFPTERALFPHHDEFLKRFKLLSTIERLDDDDNAARLAAQARSDEDLLNRMLRVYGYYDALVFRSVTGLEPGEDGVTGRPTVRFDVVPGEQYAFGAVDLGRLADATADYEALRATFEIHPGDPLLADKIVEERYDLDTALGETGYPFAAIAEPDLLVDHARTEGDLTLPVTPGGKYRFGQVTSNLPRLMSGNHLEDIARFEAGDIYQRSLELDLRRAILATGLVASVTMTPVETTPPANGEPGTVDVAVEMTQAKLRTLAGRIGYGTGEGFKLEGMWEHRNLFPPEGLLRVRAIAGTSEQLFGVTFRKNNFGGRDKILTIDAFASTIDYGPYDSRTASLVANYERVSTILFQKPLSYSGGIELVATRERERDANGNLGTPETFFVAAIPLFAQLDTSDDLLDPTRGFRLGVRLSPEASRNNGAENYYLRGQVEGSYYLRASERIVLAARAEFGSIPGAPLSAIAPSRRLYAGGGGSVRGYDFKGIGPSNSTGDPTGGRSLTELSFEARIRTGFLGGALGIVPFIDAGTVGEASTPGFRDIQIGVGVGARYHTSFGPLRIDFGIPLNPGPNDPKFGVYVGLGQSF